MPDYCTDEDVRKLCPKALRDDEEILIEIQNWKPVAQSYINDLLMAAEYKAITSNIPENIKNATSLMTQSFLLSNPYTKHNAQMKRDDGETITLSQLKERMALKLIKNLISGNYINNSLEKISNDESPASYMSLSTNSLRNLVDTHISGVLNKGYR